MPPKYKVTRKDVALLAGVSETTVSLVLNDRRDIHLSEDTRRRVRDAMESLGYHPSYAARSLARHRARTVGVLSFWETNSWFYSQILAGIQKEASAQGYATLLCSGLQSNMPELDSITYFKEGRVDGVIETTTFQDDHGSLNRMVAERVPVVVAEGSANGLCPSVCVDYAQGTALAAIELARQGCRRLLYLSPQQDLSSMIQADQQRVQGFISAAESTGLPYEVRPISQESTPATLDNELNTAKRLAEEIQSDTGVIVCYGNFARQLQYYLEALGKPTDRLIRGDYEQAFFPPLRGIHLPLFEVGRAAASLLIARLDRPAGAQEHQKIPCSLQY